MNHFKFTRLTALMLALTMLFTMAACNNGAVKPADDASSSSTSESSKIPAFINPLEDVDLSVLAEAKKPEGDLLEKMNTAYNQNNDVIGWISVPDTTIDNEVMFYPDDNLYYERRDITKGYNWYGSYWADYECKLGDRNALSRNTIIYGHSMDDNPEGLKFSQLKKYLDPEFAASHPYIYFSTPEDEMVWKVFSVMYTDTNLGFVHPDLKSAEFGKLIGEGKERSQFDFDVDVTTNDKILTLSTCTYLFGNQNDHTRFVIMARLVRPGEDMPATVKVEKNADVKAPQYKN